MRHARVRPEPMSLICDGQRVGGTEWGMGTITILVTGQRTHRNAALAAVSRHGFVAFSTRSSMEGSLGNTVKMSAYK